jgi:signal transduction histidine kinase
MTRSAVAEDFEEKDLRESVKVTVAFLSQQSRFHDISFKVSIDPDFPKRLRLNETQIHQVLLNLLGNAVEAQAENPPGALKEVKIELHHDRPQQRAIIIVADNGPGVPEDVLPQLFSKPVSTKQGGHGIGLITVKKFVDDHQGTIRVDSEPGRGARFIITLPA